MARKKGHAQVVDNAWRERVETRLTELTWSRADLAANAKVGKSTISDLLNGKTSECVNLDQIHKALGWDPPLPPLLSRDAGELLGIWERLDEFNQGRLLERARSLYEQIMIEARRSSK